jgi:hypothetical protein
MINYKNKSIIVPSHTSNLIILKSKDKYYVYIYNSRFYFLFNINFNNFKIQLNKSTLSINIFSDYVSYLPFLKVAHFYRATVINKISKRLTKLFMSWDSYYFIKIKFKGKVYKITKYKKNNLKLSFGRCHKTILSVRSLFLKKRKKVKNKCLLFGVSRNSLNLSKSLIINTRPINMFTQRGLRLSRQLVYRKIGKKSSYTTK